MTKFYTNLNSIKEILKKENVTKETKTKDLMLDNEIE